MKNNISLDKFINMKLKKLNNLRSYIRKLRYDKEKTSRPHIYEALNKRINESMNEYKNLRLEFETMFSSIDCYKKEYNRFKYLHPLLF